MINTTNNITMVSVYFDELIMQSCFSDAPLAVQKYLKRLDDTRIPEATYAAIEKYRKALYQRETCVRLLKPGCVLPVVSPPRNWRAHVEGLLATANNSIKAFEACIIDGEIAA